MTPKSSAPWANTWLKAAGLQITRYPSIDEMQFLGCTSAFIDSLTGEMNAAILFLRKLQGSRKGAAFAFEMQLDTHRYGALIVLERWGDFIHAFRDHIRLDRYPGIVEEAPARVQTAENILGRANQLIDASEHYGPEVVAACEMAFRSLHTTFREEKQAAEETARLGAMLPPGYREYRRVFLGDLASR
jgi:hypothetical protein